jgi:carbonic anhydrase/SulP family sulfate permease
MLVPTMLNMIPLSSLAAILLVTGFKLASPKLFRQMWSEGRYQFLPFIITLTAIVLTDLLIGILIGLGVSSVFILASNLRYPLRRINEKHVGGDLLHIELASQVSFLNKAALDRTLREAPAGSKVLIDAGRSKFIDPDVLSLIREFRDVIAPAHNVQVSLRGFRTKYEIKDEMQFADYTTRELQQQLTPAKVLQLLQEGNNRFRSGRSLSRDFARQLRDEVVNQHPMAVLLSGIHSRVPAEIVFDLGLGDILNIRIGGNTVGPKVIGCMEYGCSLAGAKLILVMGHTGSAMVTAAVNHRCQWDGTDFLGECPFLPPIIEEIAESIEPSECDAHRNATPEQQAVFIDLIARRNVLRSISKILQSSDVLRQLVDEGKVAAVGAMYDVVNGEIEFLLDEAVGLSAKEVEPMLTH